MIGKIVCNLKLVIFESSNGVLFPISCSLYHRKKKKIKVTSRQACAGTRET
jgi:hypothetical protein